MFNLIPWKRKQEQPALKGALVADSFEQSLARLRDEFDALLDRFWGSWLSRDEALFANGLGWSFDTEETDDAYLVRAEAPGFEADEFEVDVRGNYLNIRAEHKEEQRNGASGQSYRYGRFERTTTLPPDVDTENLSARYHSGVLELRLPKKAEARGKRIPVQAG